MLTVMTCVFYQSGMHAGSEWSNYCVTVEMHCANAEYLRSSDNSCVCVYVDSQNCSPLFSMKGTNVQELLLHSTVYLP